MTNLSIDNSGSIRTIATRFNDKGEATGSSKEHIMISDLSAPRNHASMHKVAKSKELKRTMVQKLSKK